VGSFNAATLHAPVHWRYRVRSLLQEGNTTFIKGTKECKKKNGHGMISRLFSWQRGSSFSNRNGTQRTRRNDGKSHGMDEMTEIRKSDGSP